MKTKNKLTSEMLQHHVWHCLATAERSLYDNKPVAAYEVVKNAMGWFEIYWTDNPNGEK